MFFSLLSSLAGPLIFSPAHTPVPVHSRTLSYAPAQHLTLPHAPAYTPARSLSLPFTPDHSSTLVCAHRTLMFRFITVQCSPRARCHRNRRPRAFSTSCGWASWCPTPPSRPAGSSIWRAPPLSAMPKPAKMSAWAEQNRWEDGRTDGRTVGRTDDRTVGRTDGRTEGKHGQHAHSELMRPPCGSNRTESDQIASYQMRSATSPR